MLNENNPKRDLQRNITVYIGYQEFINFVDIFVLPFISIFAIYATMSLSLVATLLYLPDTIFVTSQRINA